VGQGKTHLMQAIGNYVLNTTLSRVLYITAESFTNEFIESIRSYSTNAFKNKYRYADILLIDDIDFLPNKLETQQELFHTFNALSGANKQMVFTSDRHIDELKGLTERLASRFKSGLAVSLQAPSYETRIVIIKSKLKDYDLDLSDAVIDLVAKNIESNVRDLEAAIKQLSAYHHLNSEAISLNTAQIQLGQLFTHRQSIITIDTIIKVITEHFGLSANEIRSRKKPKHVVYPRQLAIYIASQITQGTTTEIGNFFGKDHSTVMYTVKKTEERKKSDPKEGLLINELIQKIKTTSIK
jgi:chromosomal replication initiator protein